MLIKQLFIIFVLSALAACATPDDGTGEPGGRRDDCIHQPSIRGYKVLDEQNLIIDASASKKYHVTLQRRAYGLRNSWGIGFVGTPTGRVCSGFSEIVFNGSQDTVPVRIASIRRLTPDEEEDLLIRFGLKEPEVKTMPVPQDVEGADIEELDPDANE